MMSYIFSYSKERASHTQDPRERAADLIMGSGIVGPNRLERMIPKVRTIPGKNLEVKVPILYMLLSRYKKWLKR